MRITRIETNGLKCLSGQRETPPVLVLTGPIGSGKTSILNAVQLALTGEIANPLAPDKPTKRNLDIFRLARQGIDGMDTKLSFDNDATLGREWIRKDTKDGPSVSSHLRFGGYCSQPEAKKANPGASGSLRN